MKVQFQHTHTKAVKSQDLFLTDPSKEGEKPSDPEGRAVNSSEQEIEGKVASIYYL